MEKTEILKFLNQKMQEFSNFKNLAINNNEFPRWCTTIELYLFKVFSEDSIEYKTFKESGVVRGAIEEKYKEYYKALNRREAALVSIIETIELTKYQGDTSTKEPPKAFIAHGGRSGILDKLREFIEALGIKPIIVELSPTKGMSVDDKVNKYIKDADCGIVLATKGGIVDTTGIKPKQHPRLNVIDELERLRAVFPEKTILLVERGVDLPSNVSGLTHEPFVGQSMDRAFIAIARELVEFGILKAVKPKLKERKV